MRKFQLLFNTKPDNWQDVPGNAWSSLYCAYVDTHCQLSLQEIEKIYRKLVSLCIILYYKINKNYKIILYQCLFGIKLFCFVNEKDQLTTLSPILWKLDLLCELKSTADRPLNILPRLPRRSNSCSPTKDEVNTSQKSHIIITS